MGVDAGRIGAGLGRCGDGYGGAGAGEVGWTDVSEARLAGGCPCPPSRRYIDRWPTRTRQAHATDLRRPEKSHVWGAGKGRRVCIASSLRIHPCQAPPHALTRAHHPHDRSQNRHPTEPRPATRRIHRPLGIRLYTRTGGGPRPRYRGLAGGGSSAISNTGAGIATSPNADDARALLPGLMRWSQLPNVLLDVSLSLAASFVSVLIVICCV